MVLVVFIVCRFCNNNKKYCDMLRTTIIIWQERQQLKDIDDDNNIGVVELWKRPTSPTTCTLLNKQHVHSKKKIIRPTISVYTKQTKHIIVVVVVAILIVSCFYCCYCLIVVKLFQMKKKKKEEGNALLLWKYIFCLCATFMIYITIFLLFLLPSVLSSDFFFSMCGFRFIFYFLFVR